MTRIALLLVAAFLSNQATAQSSPPRPDGPQRYSIEQAVSDQAQLHTIAFSGLAFLTGSFAASTFIPPGKVADFFGFQYMRDIDAAGRGHNPMFLDRVAGNVLRILSPEQRALFEEEARNEAVQMRDLALRRLPLIAAFHEYASGSYPADGSVLSRTAVVRHAGDMFADDALLAYGRAAVFARVAASLGYGQQAELARMRFGDFGTWPVVDMERYKLGRGTEKMVNVAYMTLASEFFSWYAGSVDADTYFCPERHGTYFGGFYLKDAPAIGKRDFDISTALTGDLGRDFIAALTSAQRVEMNAILSRQRAWLRELVDTRRAIAQELRRFLRGQQADREKVFKLGRRYGELDGELAFLYVTTFVRVGASMSAEQRRYMERLRGANANLQASAFLYADPLPQMPYIDVTPFIMRR